MSDELKIKVSVEGIKTIADAKAHLKELNKDLNMVALDNIPKQKALGDEIVRLKNIIADATQHTVTSNSKMMKSYFTLGELIRRERTENGQSSSVMRESLGAIEGFIVRLKNVIADATQHTVTANGKMMKSYFTLGEIIRRERMENRQNSFVMRESLGAIEGVIGKNKELSGTVGTLMDSYSSMSFALKAAGLSMIALPISAAIAAWTVISNKLDEIKAKEKELIELHSKQIDLQIQLGQLSGEVALAKKLDQLEEQRRKMAELRIEAEKAAQNQSLFDKYQYMSAAAWLSALWLRGKAVDKNKESQEGYNTALETEIKYMDLKKKKQDADNKAMTAYYDFLQKQREQQQQLNDLRWANHDISVWEYELDLKRRVVWAQLADDQVKVYQLKLQLAQIQKFGTKELDVVGGVSTRMKVNGGYKTSELKEVKSAWGKPGEADLSTSDNIAGHAAEFSKELSSAAIELKAFDTALGGTTNVLADSFRGLIDGSLSLAGAFKSFGDGILNMLIDMAANTLAESAMGGILGIFGLASGGDVVTRGSRLQFAASGGNFNYGRMQNVIVGERGPELMQVGRNGVRVVSNNNLRSHSGGNSEIVNAINNLRIEQRVTSRGLATVVRGGERVLRKQTY